LRMVAGSAGSADWAANLEVKCVDLTANPYLLMAGLLAAGSAGMAGRLRLPEPVDVDPAALAPEELARRGIHRLPENLHAAVDALTADDVLRRALGSSLVGAVLAVRSSEVDRFAHASPEEVVTATRWTH
jgi:glutamine synthetase